MTQLAAPPNPSTAALARVQESRDPLAHVLTPEQFRRLEDEPGVEFYDGRLVEQPVEYPMSWESSRVAGRIIALLGMAAGEPFEVEIAGSDLAYRCHPTDLKWMRKPDASVIRKERLANLGDVGVMPIPPDLAVEVLSPHDLARDVLAKIEAYLQAGFPLVWLVNPELRMVTVYRGDGSVTRLHADDEIDGGDALPRFHRRVADLFG